MSRCFPFPPPGYEKKPRSSEHGDLLAKEKHREKKHKKEKDKEKGEGKEKGRDRSKDKHNEKKERKEKHKDKKKDKDRDKTSEDRRAYHRSEVQHEDRLGNDSRKPEEVRDSRFTEELGRRIRAEEQGTANRMVEDFPATMHRRIDNMGFSPVMGKESVTGNKMVADTTGTVQRRNEKLAPSFQKRAEGLERATITDKQKIASTEKVPDLISAERRRKDNLTPPIQKKIESMGTSLAVEKQRAARNQKFEDYTSAEQRRNQVTGCLVENFSSSVEKRTEGMGTADTMQKEKRIESISSAPAMERERFVFPNTISIEQRRTGGMGAPGEKDSSVEKDMHKKMEKKEKTKQKKKAEDGKREGHKDRDQSEKKRKEKDKDQKDMHKKMEKKEKTKQKKKAEDGKREGPKDRDQSEKKRKEKDKDRHKEKKKEEKMREKGEHKHRKHDKLKASGMKGQIESLHNKTLVPHRENLNSAGVDGNNKKRKEFEIDGRLYESQHDGQPSKLPKTSASFSYLSLENGSLEFIRVASPGSSIKLGATNNTKRNLDNNDNHINGKVEARPLHLSRPHAHVAVDSRKSDEVHVLRAEVPSFAVDLSKSDLVHIPRVPPAAANSSKSHQVPSRPPHPPRVPPVAANSSRSDQVPSRPPHPPLVPYVAVNSSTSDQIPSRLPHAPSVPPPVPPVIANSSRSDQVPFRPPQPDANYLSTIYSIPKMEELLDYDDHQDWLFSRENPRSKAKFEVDGTPPQVWAKGVQIEMADVFALPYVIPF